MRRTRAVFLSSEKILSGVHTLIRAILLQACSFSSSLFPSSSSSWSSLILKIRAEAKTSSKGTSNFGVAALTEKSRQRWIAILPSLRRAGMNATLRERSTFRLHPMIRRIFPDKVVNVDQQRSVNLHKSRSERTKWDIFKCYFRSFFTK